MKKTDEINKLALLCAENLSREELDITFDNLLLRIKDVSFGNKYALWTLKKYLDGGIEKFEDMERVKVALDYYHRYKNKLEHNNKNIMNIKNLVDLENIVLKFYKTENDIYIEKLDKEEIFRNTKFIYEDNKYKILSPLNMQSSQFWGQETKWCTANTKGKNNFNNYILLENEFMPELIGSLVIIIDKEKNKKYQIHFPSLEFRDEEENFVRLEFIENLDKNILRNAFSISQIVSFCTKNILNFSLFDLPNEYFIYCLKNKIQKKYIFKITEYNYVIQKLNTIKLEEFENIFFYSAKININGQITDKMLGPAKYLKTIIHNDERFLKIIKSMQTDEIYSQDEIELIVKQTIATRTNKLGLLFKKKEKDFFFKCLKLFHNIIMVYPYKSKKFLIKCLEVNNFCFHKVKRINHNFRDPNEKVAMILCKTFPDLLKNISTEKLTFEFYSELAKHNRYFLKKIPKENINKEYLDILAYTPNVMPKDFLIKFGFTEKDIDDFMQKNPLSFIKFRNKKQMEETILSLEGDLFQIIKKIKNLSSNSFVEFSNYCRIYKTKEFFSEFFEDLSLKMSSENIIKNLAYTNQLTKDSEKFQRKDN